MTKITYKKLKRIYDSVGEREGWDFSRMKREKEELPWNYKKLILKYLKPTDRVLDIGTGGGEFFIELVPHFLEGVGIDFDSKMIETAKKNLSKDLEKKATFLEMDSKKLDFSKNSFNLVINRHAPIYPEEIYKVLKKGGYFITQQVGGRNAKNIHDIFSWPSNGEYWASYYKSRGEKSQAMDDLLERFADLNFELVRNEDAKIKYWFKNIESLVFWLKSVPLPEEFEPKKHWHRLSQFVEKYSTPKGIQTIQHRELLVTRKTE